MDIRMRVYIYKDVRTSIDVHAYLYARTYGGHLNQNSCIAPLANRVRFPFIEGAPITVCELKPNFDVECH